MRDFRTLLTVSEEFPWCRRFEPVKLAKGSLSIQASADHYCEPRETTNDLNTYVRWEIALRNEHGRLSAPPRKLAPGIRKLFEDERVVAGYVTTATVQAIINALS